jgi:hypothetical protein
LALPKLAKI